MADDGLVTIASAHPVNGTIDRLAAAVTARGIARFALATLIAAAAGLDDQPFAAAGADQDSGASRKDLTAANCAGVK
jgi:hypothetical protein